MSDNINARLRRLIKLSDILGIVLLILGGVILLGNGFLTPLLVALNLPKPVVVLAVIIVALQVFLIDARLRRFWLEIEFASLCLFAAALWMATSPSQAMQTITSQDLSSATFMLPADKIQSDLANLQVELASSQEKSPALSVLLLLVSGSEVQSYTVQLNNIKGISNTDHNPPYNKDVVKVDLSLPRGIHSDTAVSFARHLMNVTAIYLLPLASTPIPIPSSSPFTQTPTFILPNKIASDLSILQNNEKIVLLLEIDQQIYQYPAILRQIRDKDGNVLHVPFANERADNVSITLTQFTEEAVDDFIIQLSNATAIYLLPAKNGN